MIGAHGLKPLLVEQAAGHVAVGNSGSATTLAQIARSVAELYRKNGFPVAQVVDSVVADDGTLTLTVAEGTIRQIVIRGNSRTLSSVIRDTVALKPGDPYRLDTVRDARNRLARLGIFEDVVIVGAVDGSQEAKDAEEDHPKKKRKHKSDDKDADARPAAPAPPPVVASDAPTPDVPVSDEVGLVDLIVRVKEERTGNIAATVGYNDGTGLLGFFDFSEQNVGGTAQRASVQWQRTTTGSFNSNGELIDGSTRSAYLVSYDVPALGPNSTAIGGEVYDTNTVFLPFFSNNSDNLRNYELRKGGKLHVGRQFGHGGTLYLTARHDEVGYDPVPLSLHPPLDALLTADATVMAVGTNLVLDGRDAADNPRTGYLYNFTYEHAGNFLGGDRTYDEEQADLRWYAPLGASARSPLLAFRFLDGMEGNNAPLSEQFWLGGYDLLRGYDLFSIHGTRMLLTSAEVRVPFGPSFQGALFTDIGNAYLPGDPTQLSDLRASGGAGLRFLTPIGPVRFDVAYGNRVETYVSLGTSY